MRSRRKSTARRRPRQPKQQQLVEPPRYYDESDGLRRTLLLRVTKPWERAALVGLSRMLNRLLLEDGSFWRELPEPMPAIELRAAAEDLVHTAEFLRRVWSESDYDKDEQRAEERLCQLAVRQAVKIFRIAELIGAALPPRETGAV